jgi:hypothetical protein
VILLEIRCLSAAAWGGLRGLGVGHHLYRWHDGCKFGKVFTKRPNIYQVLVFKPLFILTAASLRALYTTLKNKAMKSQESSKIIIGARL